MNESYTTSYYEEESDTQLTMSDSVTLYDTSSTVDANFLSDSTTTEHFYSSTSSSTSSQSETVISTTTTLDKIEGTFYFYIDTVI